MACCTRASSARFLRGTDDEESDLDLLVDPAPKTSLLTLAGFQIEAEKLLGFGCPC